MTRTDTGLRPYSLTTIEQWGDTSDRCNTADFEQRRRSFGAVPPSLRISPAVDAVLETLHRNVALSRQIIRTVSPTLTGDRPCACARALETAVLTPRNQIPAATRKRLSLFLGKKGA